MATSVSDGQSLPGSATSKMPVSVRNANIEVDDYALPVTFTVRSLATGNDICFASEACE